MEEQADYKNMIEGALFMSQNAVGVSELSRITGIMSPGHIQKLLDELISEYNGRNTSLTILSIDKKYMFSLKEPYASKLSSMANGPDITKGALRLLAYISKNNGIAQSSLVKAFGASTYDHIKELIEAEFIEAKKSGRTKKITTTNKFKEYFNV